VAGAEDLMLPVQRVELDSNDLDVSATLGHLYARHQPRVRRIAPAGISGSVRAALLFPLDAPFTVTGRSAAATVLRIPREAAAELAEERAGIPAAELRFESMGAISAAVRGITVAAIAGRWGFSRPDRFAAAYRTAYGRPPRHTLRR
jgi:hypothetical protein